MIPDVPLESEPVRPRRPWLLVPLAVLLLAGVGVCLYLTRFHDIEVYGDQSATLSNCPQTETTNCEVVNTSGYSEFLGVPISALGIPTYLLLLFLVVRGWRNRRFVSHAFAIGLLTIAYSVYLYYVSTVKIGYLCVWCFRLYCINAGIPLFAGLAAWRNPFQLLGEAFADLRPPFAGVRRTAMVFASLLIVTVAGERVYRASLAGAPVAAGQQEESTPTQPGVVPAGMTPATTAQAASGPFHADSPLKEYQEQGGKLQMKPFNLNERLGKGKPVALIFWEPGARTSEEGLVSLARFLQEQTPQISVYAVVGATPDERPEIQWESFCLMEVPQDLPLLRDENFSLFKQLALPSVPYLALFDARGVLVTSQIQGLKQTALAPGGISAEEILRRVARGESPGPVPAMRPYYPSSELFGHCAPAFHLPELFSGKDTDFTGRSMNGKPTLLMFWSATCKHCQKEIPQLVRYVKTHPAEFNLVSVAMIHNDSAGGFSHRKVTEAYVKTNQLPWTVLDDSSGYAASLYRVISTPTTILISPSGEILGAWYHPHENLEMAIGPVVTQLGQHRGECAAPPAEQAMRATFNVADAGGRSVSLESLAGRPSILHFWATWCAPCQSELPKLLKLREAINRKGGQLILVSVEDPEAAARVQKFGSSLASGFESFLAPRGGLADRLDMSYSVPRTYLLAGGGEVLQTYRGVLPWEDPAFERSVFTMLQLN